MADGNVDVMVQPGEVGSAQIQQFGVQGEFRLLLSPDDKLQSEKMKGLMGRPGHSRLSGATLLIGIAAIGIIVGSLDSTGLGLKLANVIRELRGEGLFSALPPR